MASRCSWILARRSAGVMLVALLVALLVDFGAGFLFVEWDPEFVVVLFTCGDDDACSPAVVCFAFDVDFAVVGDFVDDVVFECVADEPVYGGWVVAAGGH